MQAPNTIYESIKQLEPGQVAIIDGKSIELKELKKHPVNVTPSGLSDGSDEALSQFDTLFSKVCHDQLKADVPIGTFLSGGIDSTFVIAFLKSTKRI